MIFADTLVCFLMDVWFVGGFWTPKKKKANNSLRQEWQLRLDPNGEREGAGKIADSLEFLCFFIFFGGCFLCERRLLESQIYFFFLVS